MRRKEQILAAAKRDGVRVVPNYVLGMVKQIVRLHGYSPEEAIAEISSVLVEMDEVIQDESLPWFPHWPKTEAGPKELKDCG